MTYPKRRPRNDLRLKYTDLGKWLSMCKMIMDRHDGRDTLIHRILIRSLLELQTRRKTDLEIEKKIIRIRDHSYRTSPKEFRKELEDLIEYVKDSSKIGNESMTAVPKPDGQYYEVVRSDLLDQINALLKPYKYNLILQYDPMDLSQESFVRAEFVKLQD